MQRTENLSFVSEISLPQVSFLSTYFIIKTLLALRWVQSFVHHKAYQGTIYGIQKLYLQFLLSLRVLIWIVPNRVLYLCLFMCLV